MATDAALVTRPTRDSPQNGGTAGPYAYGQIWMRSVLNSLLWRGGTRKQLYGDDAVRSKFEEAVQSLDPSLFVGMGHGSENAFSGQYVEGMFGGEYSVLLTIENADLMAGRVVCLCSCLTAKQLGPALIEKGAVAYAGYNQPFAWVVSTPETPWFDRHAEPFGRAVTKFPKTLVYGKTVGAAKEEALKVFEQEMERWEKSDDPYAREVVKWLNFDMQAFTVLGSEETKGLEPKVAAGLVATAAGVGAGAIGYVIYRWRKKR